MLPGSPLYNELLTARLFIEYPFEGQILNFPEHHFGGCPHDGWAFQMTADRLPFFAGKGDVEVAVPIFRGSHQRNDLEILFIAIHFARARHADGGFG